MSLFKRRKYTQEEIDTYQKETQDWWTVATEGIDTHNIVINNSFKARMIMGELHRRNKKHLKMMSRRID